jgi:hypothetical protein
MSTSKQNPNPSNPGIARPTRLGTLLPVGNQVSQIRGVASAGSLGAGIPNAVSAVSVVTAPAVTGSSTKVTVSFQADPSDANFSHAKVFVRGYHGNSSWVQVAASDTAPITFVFR